MRTVQLFSLLLCPALLSASLISSASVADGPFCLAVSDVGTSSAHVILTCQHPGGGFTYQAGRADATAALGELSAEVVFWNAYGSGYTNGSSFAEFAQPMRVLSPSPGPLFLEFLIRLTGGVENHAESNAFAASRWLFNGADLGYVPFGSGWEDRSFDAIVLWPAPIALSSGDVFTLSSRVNASASRDFGDARSSAQLVQVIAHDALGGPVPASVEFVPEPGTWAVSLAGLVAVTLLLRVRNSGAGC
jgi:hypothetical protein